MCAASVSDISLRHNGEVLVHCGHRTTADLRVAGLLVVPQSAPCLIVESGEQIEGDVRRLIVLRVGRRDIRTQRTERRFAREWPGDPCRSELHCMTPGHEAGCDGFRISFDS